MATASSAPSMWEVGGDPEHGVLEGAELMDAVDGSLRAQLTALWENRLSASDNTSRSELARASYLSAEDGGASCLVSEPSRFVLDKSSSSISEVRTSLGNAVSSSNARRTLTRGGLYLLGRPAITVAEREGRDTEQAPAGTGMRLGRRYLSARCLHVRQLSANSVLAVTLCRTLSSGVRGRALVSVVLVRSPLSTDPLIATSQPPHPAAPSTTTRESSVSELDSELSELDGEPADDPEPGSMDEAVSVAQGMLARTGGADAVAAIAASPDMDDDIASLAAQVLQQTSSLVETEHSEEEEVVEVVVDVNVEEEQQEVEEVEEEGEEDAAVLAGDTDTDGSASAMPEPPVTWQIAHEDVQVYGAVPSIPTQPEHMAPLPHPPGSAGALIPGAKMSKGLRSFLGGVAETVLERCVNTWSTAPDQDDQGQPPAGESVAAAESKTSGGGPDAWLGKSKAAYWSASSAREAAQAALQRDLSVVGGCSLAVVAPEFGSEGRLPAMEFVASSSSREDCAALYASKFFAAPTPAEQQPGAGGQQARWQQQLSATYTVEAAREIVPGELAVVLLWISLDDGPVRKLMNALFGTFSSQKRSFCQDRLGTNIGETQKEREAFCAGPSVLPNGKRCAREAAATTTTTGGGG
jgi:hypothetical protein